MTILWVALGSALGGVLRFLASRALNSATSITALPWGTLSVNILGSLLIGALSGWLAHCASAHVAAVRAFAIVGFCGGFTTFSTFSNETFRMLENGELARALIYVLLSMLAGVFAVAFGYFLAGR